MGSPADKHDSADAPAGLRVRTLARSDRPAWDAHVRASPQGTPFSLSSYLDAFAADYSVLVAESDGAIEAGLVLARGALGLRTNPLFVKHLGVLYAPFAGKPVSRASRERRAAAALVSALRRHASFDYTDSPDFVDWLPFHWAGFAQETRYTYRIAPEQTATWREAADSRTRNDLRRAERAGLFPLDTMPTSAMVDLAAGTYRRRGARPPFNATRLAAAVDRLRAADMAEIVALADASGAPVAAALLVTDARAAFLTITGYADAAPPGATALTIAHAIERAHARGLVFDFEGSMIAPIESFYRGFGGTLTPYFRIWRRGPLNAVKHAGYGAARRLLGYAR
jgi:hypothetical protein